MTAPDTLCAECGADYYPDTPAAQGQTCGAAGYAVRCSDNARICYACAHKADVATLQAACTHPTRESRIGGYLKVDNGRVTLTSWTGPALPLLCRSCCARPQRPFAKLKGVRREHARLYWRVTIRWQDICLDGLNHGEQSVTYRFPSNYSEADAYEAASMRWDDYLDWLPSEYERACRTYRAVAKLIRTCDVPYLN